MISLGHMLAYLLDKKRYTGLLPKCQSDIKKSFQDYKRKKKLITADDYCGFHKKETSAFLVKSYLETVLQYGFKDEPEYEKLRFLL